MVEMMGNRYRNGYSNKGVHKGLPRVILPGQQNPVGGTRLVGATLVVAPSTYKYKNVRC